ncbi:MAG: hypothetical protein IPP90_08370 [Gemmatimonadaceae bacterium]|nr:hypothetical protein [Gemmatimonadaceae bacterium]
MPQHTDPRRIISVTMLAASRTIVTGMSNPLKQPHPQSPPVLLSVRDLHEEIRAGYGQTVFAVRTLDGVSLDVRAGELVVLQGGVASGAVSLLETLAGTRRRLSGLRVAAHGVQIRRGSISHEAFRAITNAWSPSVGITAPIDIAPAPVVYVFRVRPRTSMVSPSPKLWRTRTGDPSTWRAWVESLRARGGSVLVYVSPSGHARGHPPHSGARLPDPHVDAVHEGVAALHGYGVESGMVRVLTLAAGRIVGAHRHHQSPRHRVSSAPPRDRLTPYIQHSPHFEDSPKDS